MTKWFVRYEIASGRVRESAKYSDASAAALAAGLNPTQAAIISDLPPSVPGYAEIWVEDGQVVDIDQADQAVVEATLLPERRVTQLVRLQRELANMVDYQPSGLERYPATWRDAAAKLDPTALTTEQAARLQAVEDWINGLYAGVYYPTKATIEACATLAELDAVAWDLSAYEVGSGQPEADPDVSLTELTS